MIFHFFLIFSVACIVAALLVTVVIAWIVSPKTSSTEDPIEHSLEGLSLFPWPKR